MGVFAIILATIGILMVLPLIFDSLLALIGVLMSMAYGLVIAGVIIFGLICVIGYINNPDRKRK